MDEMNNLHEEYNIKITNLNIDHEKKIKQLYDENYNLNRENQYLKNENEKHHNFYSRLISLIETLSFRFSFLSF